MTLPPGQRSLADFPRFGTHLHHRPPRIPDDPVVEIVGGGAVRRATLDEIAALPRRTVTADFHCVAGWSATGLRWEGVAFATLYRAVIEPLLGAAAGSVSHVSFEGYDRYRSTATLEDALHDDVLVADRLDGGPLDPDHGAPLRLVSPAQYGFISTKHLSRIELHSAEPPARYHAARHVQLGLQIVKPHPRARVWHEERHRYLPAWAVRLPYRQVIPLIRSLSGRGRSTS